mmetsp:Transcript_9412/g.14394  ORF Transcript_9412/g.14394 Transcript_9412/m.14394 type:complete len:115 (+) Transcript_9412:192-536(+)
MNRLSNQDFGIDDKKVTTISESTPRDCSQEEALEQADEATAQQNWDTICEELDKMGIIVEEDIKAKYIQGDGPEIIRLFQRIEKYIVRITLSDEVLEFQDCPDLFKPEHKAYSH